MKYNKDNVIYIDFTFRRKRIKSKPFLLLYKCYSKFRKVLLFKPIRSSGKKSTLSNNRETSNY